MKSDSADLICFSDRGGIDQNITILPISPNERESRRSAIQPQIDFGQSKTVHLHFESSGGHVVVLCENHNSAGFIGSIIFQKV